MGKRNRFQLRSVWNLLSFVVGGGVVFAVPTVLLQLRQSQRDQEQHIEQLHERRDAALSDLFRYDLESPTERNGRQRELLLERAERLEAKLARLENREPTNLRLNEPVRPFVVAASTGPTGSPPAAPTGLRVEAVVSDVERLLPPAAPTGLRIAASP